VHATYVHSDVEELISAAAICMVDTFMMSMMVMLALDLLGGLQAPPSTTWVDDIRELLAQKLNAFMV